MTGPLRLATQADLRHIEANDLLGIHTRPASTFQLLEASTEQAPDRPWLTFLPDGLPTDTARTSTANQILRQITSTANALHGLGVTRDQPVALLLTNRPETHWLMWGAQAAGIAAPLNPSIGTDRIVGLLRRMAARIVATESPDTNPKLWDAVAAAVEQTEDVHTIIEVDDLTAAPPVERPPARNARVNRIRLHDLLDGADPDRLHATPARAEDVASLFHTGGTTGAPKLAPHTHANQTFLAKTFGPLVDIDSDSRVLCGLPLFHVNAALLTGLCAWAVGAEVVLAGTAGFRGPGTLANLWETIRDRHITHMSAVPAVVSDLLRTIPSDHTTPLHTVICGAAPLASRTLQDFEQAAGVRILEGYGMTEGTCVSTLNPPHGDPKPGSVGLPLPHTQVVVAREGDADAPVALADTEEIGNVLIRGPHVFPGYLEDGHHGWRSDPHGQRWFDTGDRGYLDHDGYLWLTGRTKDVIIRSGHNIDPQVIEEAVSTHPAVQTCVAVGRPHPRSSEVPVAYVVPRPGQHVDDGQILEHARHHIAEPPARPVDIVVVDDLPRTAVGKVYRPELRAQQTQHAAQQLLRTVDDTAEVSVAHTSSGTLLATVSSATLPPDEVRAALAPLPLTVQVH